MRERRREKEVEEEEERRKLREEMARLTMEQKELKIKFEEEVAQHNQLLGQATRKETTLAADFEQSVAEGGSDEGSMEENKVGSDANLEERMCGVASQLEERVLLSLEAKLEQMVESEVMLRLGEAEQEQLEKSVKLEELVEKTVRLRLGADQNQLASSSTNRSGAKCYDMLKPKMGQKVKLLRSSDWLHHAMVVEDCLSVRKVSHQIVHCNPPAEILCFSFDTASSLVKSKSQMREFCPHHASCIRFETSPDLPPDGWKLCDGQVLSMHKPYIVIYQPLICNGNLFELHHLHKLRTPRTFL